MAKFFFGLGSTLFKGFENSSSSESDILNNNVKDYEAFKAYFSEGDGDMTNFFNRVDTIDSDQMIVNSAFKNAASDWTYSSLIELEKLGFCAKDLVSQNTSKDFLLNIEPSNLLASFFTVFQKVAILNFIILLWLSCLHNLFF
jgi:hypothetical protein